MKGTSPENGSSSPRTREASTLSLDGLAPDEDNRYQLTEGAVESVEESDSP